MFRKFLFCLVTMLFLSAGSASLHGQADDERFVRRYDAGWPLYTRIANIWPSDSGYKAFLFTADSTPTRNLFGCLGVLELDRNFDSISLIKYGDTIKRYGDWFYPTYTIPDGKGNFWYIAYCHFFTDTSYNVFTHYGKFDQDGDTLFERRLPNTDNNDLPWEIVATPNGAVLTEYVYIAPYHRTRIHFLDDSGNIIAVDSINPLVGSYHEARRGLSVDTAKQEVYVTTSDYYYQGWIMYNFRPRTFVYDFQGNLLRSKNYGLALKDFDLGYLHRTEDKGYVGMATKYYVDSTQTYNYTRSAIVKLDSAMSVEWTREYWPMKFDNYSTCLVKDSQGNFYLGGTRDTAHTMHTVDMAVKGFLMKFSPDLDSLWCRLFTDTTDTTIDITFRYAAQILVLNDQSIIYLMDVIPPAGKYSLLFKLDSCGYLVEQCVFDTVIPPPPDTVWPNPGGSLLAYPNPGDGVFDLVWDVIPGDISTLRVMDVAGRMVFESFLVREERPSRVDLRGVGQGVYLLEVRSEQGRKFHCKVVVMR
jgi:hypothetical protein